MKRIGLVIPEIADPLDYELLRGIYAQAAALGADVAVLCGVLNPMPGSQQDAYTEGFSNIYDLVRTGQFDGILFAASRFHDDALRQRIFSLFTQTNTPVLTLDYQQGDHPCIIAEQHDGAYAMTMHLIREHGCQKLWCIAGFPEDAPSLERLRGFTDVMQEAGLPVGADAIHFGHYWRDIPEQLARGIAAGEYEIPDGVVCLSDAMAIYFGDALRKSGIAVPEQVKVTGYDGMWYSAMHDPITTTVCGRELQLGEAAVCRLFEMISGKPVQPIGSRQTIRFGTSCGCSFEKTGAQSFLLGSLQKQVAKQLFRGFEKRSYLSNDFISRMADAESLAELTQAIDGSSYLLHGWKHLGIALCEDWCPDFENPYAIRQQGFSDVMQCILSRSAEGVHSPECRFETPALFPETPHAPMLWMLTSLHCKGQIFGYCVQGFDDPDAPELDDYFVNWTDAVSTALHSLQKRLYIRYLHEQMEAFSTVDAVTELPNKRGFTEQLPDLLHRLRKAGTPYSVLLLSWMEEDATAVYNMAVLTGNILKRQHFPLCARLGEQVFAVLLTGDGQAESCMDTLRSGLAEALGNPALLPDLISEEMALPGKKPAEIEKAVEQLCADFLQKREAEISHTAAYREQLYQLRRDLSVHPEQEWSITEISRTLGISRSHLQRLYKQQFAASIKDDLIGFRMSRAMQLLAHTDLRVQEIAEQCGYHNENHFMRQFKDKNGMTALQYRREYKI